MNIQQHIIRSDDAIDKHKIPFEIFKRILSSYCEMKSRKSQSQGHNNGGICDEQ